MRVVISILLLIFLSCTSRHKSDVTALDLSNRNLSSIPDSIFFLTKLEYLLLGNSFTLYPPLSALATDNSYGQSLNKITEIPDEIRNLQQLRTLNICFNDLRSLPKEIIELKKLDTLDLSFNKHLDITKVFRILQEMSWLKSLNIVATNVDTATIDKLRKALPKTKIYATFEDLELDAVNLHNP